jgi:UDP-N-acetylglucosamine 2-epimerase (non-hydrolysing)
MEPKKIMLVFGTRPEAVKMAPLALALQQVEWCKPIIAVTAQHREMLDQVMQLFGLTADYDLDMLTPGQTLTDVTTKALQGLGPIMESVRPDAVVVQGDTTTTFAGALAAFYRQIPVVHMEAGLRTDDPSSPFPEEINRRLTTQLTTLHLAATPTSAANLTRDGIKKDHIAITGNTVIDALHWAVDRKPAYDNEVLEALDTHDRKVLLVTAHRRESWGEGMRQIGAALREIATRHPDVEIIFPIHKNPLVRDAIVPAVEGVPNVSILEPLAYGAFSRLMNRATIVLTDSGGVQEEAPSLGKPVLVMRDTTERPEAVAAGTARLIGTHTDRIVDAVHRLLTIPAEFAEMANAVNPYGDGLASQRTIEAMGHLFGLCDRPSDFAG